MTELESIREAYAKAAAAQPAKYPPLPAAD
jgi:hypothetical protein